MALGGLLTVVVVAAVASIGVVGSASGGPLIACSGPVTTAPTYCVEGVQLGNGVSEKIVGTASVSILKATVASTVAEIECKSGKSTGSIKGGAAGAVGKSKVLNFLEECKMLQPTNCKLPVGYEREIETSELTGTLGLTTGRIEDKFAEGGYVDIAIEGKDSSCVIAEVGKPKVFEISGVQRCEIDKANSEAETESTTHKIICKASGGNLKIGGNKAEITNESTVKLVSGKKWSVKEST